MSKEKKNYILFRYCKYYNEVNYSWKKTYYTRKGLVHELAVAEMYRDDSILKNLVDELMECELKRVVVKSNLDPLGWYYKDKPIYYIGKENSGVVRRVDADELIEEVIEEIARYSALRDKRQSKYRARQRLMNCYTFRRESVPGIHKYRSHRGSWYRHPSTTSSKRIETYADEEYSFRDCKIRQLPNVYDDLYRHNDKSWKTSYKIRKQWEKHQVKHIDSDYFNKRQYIEEINITDEDLYMN